MRVAFIGEGVTDYHVLSAVLRSRSAAVQACVAIQPKVDALRSDAPGGWTLVRDYLQRKGRDLANLARFGGFQFVLIHVDGDVLAPEPPPEQTLEAFWQEVETRLRTWAGLEEWPEAVLIAIPLMCLETWIAAATPGYPGRNPQMETVGCTRICQRMPEPRERQAMEAKDTMVYRDVFAPRVAQAWPQVVDFCPVGAGRLERQLQRMQRAETPDPERGSVQA